jgi:hypothetical protein
MLNVWQQTAHLQDLLIEISADLEKAATGIVEELKYDCGFVFK